MGTGAEQGSGPPLETRWKPGQSGNPNGRPKGIAARVRELVKPDEIVEGLLKEARTATSARDRIAAWNALTDRGWGKAPAFAAVEGMDPLELDEVASEIQRIADDLRRKREERGTDTGPATVAA